MGMEQRMFSGSPCGKRIDKRFSIWQPRQRFLYRNCYWMMILLISDHGADGDGAAIKEKFQGYFILMKRKQYTWILLILAFIAVLVLILTKRLKITCFFAQNYSVRGVDVSHYGV